MWSVSVRGRYWTLGSLIFYLRKVFKPLVIFGGLVSLGMLISLFMGYRDISVKKDEVSALRGEESKLLSELENLKRTPSVALRDKEELYMLMTGLIKENLVSASVKVDAGGVSIEDMRFNTLTVKISCPCPGELFLRFYEELKREYIWVRLDKMNVVGGRINAEFTVFVR